MRNSPKLAAAVSSSFRQAMCALARRWCPPDTPQPPAQQKERPAYFVAGQISVTVAHRTRLEPARLATSASGQLAEALKTLELDSAVRADPARVVTFQLDKEDFLSIVFAEAPALRADPATLLRTVLTLNKPLLDRPRGQQTSAKRTGEAGAADDAPATDEPLVQRYSPNWTAGGANQNIGGGGPSARPVVPTTPFSSAGNPWDITISGLNIKLPPDQRGAGVQVAILDTAIEPGDVAAAFAKWNMTSPTATPNALLDTLFQPGGPLQITPGGYSHLLQLANFHIATQPYVMADHGTFIAGIIHSIAPAAQIQLIEVLNPLGAGTLETILRGFQSLVDGRLMLGQIADAPPMVVNLSLVLSTPTAGMLEALAAQDPIFQNVSADDLEATLLSITSVVQALHGHNVVFVAAAGNESSPQQRIDAGYPAALTQVIGVGALDRNDNATDYTNIADRTPETGLAAFGGTRTASGDADPADGILGIYTGVFPDGTSTNDLGLARWSGTSFATPIISGALAALLSDNLLGGALAHPDPEQDLRASDAQPLLPIGEIVHAQQG